MDDPSTDTMEVIRAQSIEAWTLVELGYSHTLDVPLPGSDILGKDFLSAYGDSPHREATEDLLEGFKDMDPAEPDYEPTKTYILRYLEAQFGPPQPQNGNL
jgi:hypothetical protein